MADVTITAANVAYVSGNVMSDQVAGEAFTAGMAVYLSDAGTWLKAQGDGTAVQAGSNKIGVALFTADAASSRGSIAVGVSVVAYGAIFTAGLIYTVADTAGGIRPSADNGSTDKATIIGQAISTSQLRLLPDTYNAGAVIA